ncbi:MAG TPA: response regulator [Pirellulales bacterium]|nr:response regulator [Pirellulales bacterium]
MRKKVLLCDDETHILRAAEIKLTRSGYDVATAIDGQAAWESIQRDRPDILVTDLQMPRMDGLELSRRVRENPATQDLPILMLTAKGFESAHIDPAEQCGVLAILPKPFSPRELVRCIDNVLTSGAITVG